MARQKPCRQACITRDALNAFDSERSNEPHLVQDEIATPYVTTFGLAVVARIFPKVTHAANNPIYIPDI